MQRQLSNEQFLAKAPPKVVEGLRKQEAELKALIEQTVQTLSATSAKAFDGAEDRRIELQLQGSRVLEADGLQFLWRWSIPSSPKSS